MSEPSAVRYRRIQRDLHDLTRPYIAMKMEILNGAQPRYVFQSGKPLDVEYPEETRRGLAQIDVWMNEAIEAY